MGVSEKRTEAIATAEGESSPALEVAYFWNRLRDIGVRTGVGEQNDCGEQGQRQILRTIDAPTVIISSLRACWDHRLSCKATHQTLLVQL